MHPFRILLLFCLAAAALTGLPQTHAQAWLPRHGAAALHQRCLELETPTVVLLVAPRPGAEDLPLLSYLRFRAGAKVAVAYVTNGEAEPADTLANVPVLLAVERKAEADRVVRETGADAWFLNMPDPGGVPDAQILDRSWPSDTLVARLVTAIRTHKPDLIVVGRDRADDLISPLDSVVRQSVTLAAQRAATARDTSRALFLLPWESGRILSESPGPGLPPEFRVSHPFWKLPANGMARSLASRYRTMRLTIGLRQDAGRSYRTEEGKAVPVRALLAGLPRIPRTVLPAGLAVRRAIAITQGTVRTATLRSLTTALDSVERVLRLSRDRLTPLEQRLAVAWKNGLEDARCTVLGVSLEMEPGDSLVTGHQVLFMRLRALKPAWTTGTTEIIFPAAMNHDWMVNETMAYRFPLTVPAEFKILTPEHLEYNTPMTQFGMTAAVLRTRFPFFIVHHDPQRERNFLYRGELLLRTGPRRSFELRTPLVRALPGSPVVVAMLNISRDPFTGTITLSDTGGLSTSRPLVFRTKDEYLVDSLPLPYAAPPAPGNYAWRVELSARGGRYSLTARSFAVQADSATPVRVLSVAHGSPVVEAIRSMPLQPAAGTDVLPRGPGVLVVDRDALSGDGAGPEPGVLPAAGEVRAWLAAGGRMVVFPQHGEGARRLQEICGATFRPIRPLSPGAPVALAGKSPFLSGPNMLDTAVWEGWVVSRGVHEVVLVPGQTPKGQAPMMQAPQGQAGAEELCRVGGSSMITRIAVGKGEVICVALDLWSQLINLHPGAHRLLANILAVP